MYRQPSVSPIYEKHRLLPPTTTYRCYPTTYWYSMSRYWNSWANAWASATSSAGLVADVVIAGYYTRGYTVAQIDRKGLYYDLSPLPPGKTILSATMHVHLYRTKYANGSLVSIADSVQFIDFPTYSWPPVNTDYAKIRVLTDIAFEQYIPLTGPSPFDLDFPLPQHTLNTMQGKPRLALAYVSKRDHTNSFPGTGRVFSCAAYRYTFPTYVDVTVQS
jgi:hypothetical protein